MKIKAGDMVEYTRWGIRETAKVISANGSVVILSNKRWMNKSSVKKVSEKQISTLLG